MTPTPQPDSRDGERKCPMCGGFGMKHIGTEKQWSSRCGHSIVHTFSLKDDCPTCGGTGKRPPPRRGRAERENPDER